MFVEMALRWTTQWGGTFRGWDGESLAADVVPYHDWQLGEPGPDGLRRVKVTNTYWRAYVALEPVGGRFPSADDAKAAAEAAVVKDQTSKC